MRVRSSGQLLALSSLIKKSRCDNVSLNIDNKMISDQVEVCNAFNDFFVNVSSDDEHCDSVDEAISKYAHSPSISSIRMASNSERNFNFSPVSTAHVEAKLKKLKASKAPGHDNVPAKLLKLGAHVLSATLTPIVNGCLTQSLFPQDYKYADVRPIHKKKDVMDMGNYRPVSVLTSASKIVEGIICDQMMSFLDSMLSPMLSAYRDKYSCVNVLLRCTEEWKMALDNNEVVGCILMDLSKAFDLIPHDLLIAKLSAYGFSLNACALIKDYLSSRRQRVKIGNHTSDWLDVKSGVPQDSLTGPILFNVFVNDLLASMKDMCTVYNYADDNTLSFSHSHPGIVKDTLEKAANYALQWFRENHMKANPTKFQAMVLGRNGKGDGMVFCLSNGVTIEPSEHVTLLGLNLDKKLTFNCHVTELSKKCAKQINVIARLSKHLNDDCRLLLLNTFILSNLNYCSAIYHYCGVTDAKKLESIQKRCIRHVLQDFNSTYQEMLNVLKLPTLYDRRLRNVLECVFKVLRNELPPVENILLCKKDVMILEMILCFMFIDVRRLDMELTLCV